MSHPVTAAARALRPAAGALGAALLALGAAPSAAADAPAPGLVLGAPSPVSGVRPGARFEVPASFTNTGPRALDGVWLSYRLTQGLSPAEVPSNCLAYPVASADEQPGGREVVCAFERRVEPGVVYAPAKDLGVEVTAKALRDRVRVTVAAYPLGGGDAHGAPERGTAPEVALERRPDAVPAPPGSAENEDWDAANVAVSADNTADLRVSASRLSGGVGSTVPLRITLTNAGPAWVLGEQDTPVTRVRVTLPEGTTVVDADSCAKDAPGVYLCGTPQHWLDAGRSETTTLKVRIDKDVPGAQGSVRLGDEDRPFDPAKANDTATIRLEVTGGTGAGASGAADSGGPASTGSSPVLPLAGATTAALLGGAGVVYAVRRRRAA